MKINLPAATLLFTIISRIDLIINLIANSVQLSKEKNMTDIAFEASKHTPLYWIIQAVITVIIAIVVYKVFDKLNKQSISIGIIFALMNERPISMKSLAKFLKKSEAKQLREMGVLNLSQEQELIKEINEFEKQK